MIIESVFQSLTEALIIMLLCGAICKCGSSSEEEQNKVDGTDLAEEVRLELAN